MLNAIDMHWRRHLTDLDVLREGIGLRAMAQRDPLVEYKREGFEMFSAMLDAIKEESVGHLFNLEVQVQEAEPEEGAEAAETAEAVEAAGAADGARAATTPVPAASVISSTPDGAGEYREPREPAPALSAKGLSAPARPSNLRYSAPSLDSAEPARTEASASTVATSTGEPGRNAPCPCGSGKKYKRCHGAPGMR